MTNLTTRSLVQRLESLRRAGVTHILKVKKQAAMPTAKELPAEVPAVMPIVTPVALPVAVAPMAVKPTSESREAALAVLAQKVAACTRCKELAKTRTQTVFGVGNPHADLVFCGEAPGADEDLQGEPFVGRAGQLLNDIITKGMKLQRKDVYILNILRCRPPQNRAPLPDEAAACREYLDGQLSIIQPKFICCLGAVAAQNLLATDTTIGRLRGQVLEYNGIKVVCTYHPAYVLRNPQAKRPVWDDIQMLMAEMKKAGCDLPS